MNNENYTATQVIKNDLIDKARDYQVKGYRLIQLHCTKTLEEMFITYSFENEKMVIENLRLDVADDETVPSISSVFAPGFLYENEIHDLFGVSFAGMSIDFQGNLYKTAVKYPFRDVRAPKAPSKKE